MHIFLAEGWVDREDVARLIALTDSGELKWSHSGNHYALNAYPTADGAMDYEWDSVTAVGMNLRGIRIGYRPSDQRWHYLRMVAHDGRAYYIEAGSPIEQLVLCEQLYELARAKVWAGS